MTKTALITGASSGIGLELARVHAAKKGNLVLVARNKTKLDEIKSELENEYKIQVYTIGKDLSTPNASKEVYEETRLNNIEIDFLINNAGIGDFGLFNESKWDKQLEMIQLNITALTQMTHLYLQDMVKRKGGKIMNVSSTAAFQSGPYMSVYFATKSFVLNFSEAINFEVKKHGISVTALCPGATESGFKVAASLQESGLFKGKKIVTSNEVAIFGYNAMMKGKSIAIHGIINYFMANSVRFIPRRLAVWFVKKMME